MAKIIPSALVNSISGSVGGTTFTRQRSQQFCQAKPRTRRTKIGRQVFYQSFWADTSNAWANLSATARTNWQAAHNELLDTSPQGWYRTRSTRAFFIDQNLPLTIRGLSPITDPKLIFDQRPKSQVTLTATSTSNVTLDLNIIPILTYDVVLYLGVSYRGGTRDLVRSTRLITYLLDQQPPIQLAFFYTFVFGPLQSGMQIRAGWRTRRDDSLLTVPNFLSTTVP